MLLTCSEMRALEERTFAAGITAEALMEEAGANIANAVRQCFPKPGRCIAVFGKGHNGGDALVAARYLRGYGWRIELRAVFPKKDWAPLTRQQHERLPNEQESERPIDPLASPAPLVILDGLLGIAAVGALREPIRGMCREINRLRREENARVFALDLPTGLDGDSGAVGADGIEADYTLTIGCAKTGLLVDEALNFVGRLAILPLTEFTLRLPVEVRDCASVATASKLRKLLPPRNFATHKGQAGRVGILAGSVGTIGAAILAASGALHGGAGLVTLHVPKDIYEIVATRTPPEIMVRPVDSPLELLERGYHAIAIGPGMGGAWQQEILELIAQATEPMVIDADGLNTLATDLTVLDHCAGPRLLTPHPGEMARLDPESKSRSRRDTVDAFTKRWPQTLLLKGSRSIVGERDRLVSFNPTGHPGLATGGVGDVLTGVLGGLAGQGLCLFDSARVGSWVIGRAAERAVLYGGQSAESLTPSHVLENLGGAFGDLRAGVY